jgi:hypothetical protein
LLLVLLPMVLIGTTLLTLIAAASKSVKEAQSYMSVLMLLPIIPTVVLMVNPIKNQLWQFAVPFLAQNQMILKLVRSEDHLDAGMVGVPGRRLRPRPAAVVARGEPVSPREAGDLGVTAIRFVKRKSPASAGLFSWSVVAVLPHPARPADRASRNSREAVPRKRLSLSPRD